MTDWEQIRREHGPAVWAVAYRILAHDEDARDCLQEVFLEAIRSPQSAEVRNWGGFLRWLATRRAIDALRKRRRQATHAMSAEPSGPTQADQVELNETIEIIRRELARLPESQAAAFWMSSAEQMTYEQIAEHMHITPNAVGLLIHRARQQLKVSLRSLVEGQEPTR